MKKSAFSSLLFLVLALIPPQQNDHSDNISRNGIRIDAFGGISMDIAKTLSGKNGFENKVFPKRAIVLEYHLSF